MEFVGLDPGSASELAARLEQASNDLNAHASTVESLLAQAEIVSCRAGAELREIAAWAAYRARDLRRRIDRIVAADHASGGTDPVPRGFRFATPALARKAGRETAKDMKKMLDDDNHVDLDFEMDRLRQYGDDPDFAGAFFSALGADDTRDLLKLAKKTERKGDGPVAEHAVALAAQRNKLSTHFMNDVRHGHRDKDDPLGDLLDLVCGTANAFSWLPPKTADEAAGTVAAHIATKLAPKAASGLIGVGATGVAIACQMGDSPPGQGTNGTAIDGAPGGFDHGMPVRASADQSNLPSPDWPMEPISTAMAPSPITTSTTTPPKTTHEGTDGASPP
jgi:hypothetical protein